MRTVVALALFAFCAIVTAQESGVLLGLADEHNDLRTVFVSQKGVAIVAKDLGPGVYLAQDIGLLKVTVEESNSYGAVAVVVKPPSGEASKIQGEEGRPLTRYIVSYVSPFGIGLTQSMMTEFTTTSGGGFADNRVERFPSVFRNLAWSDLGTAVEVGSVFDQKTVDTFHSASTRLGIGGGVEYDREASPTNWTLMRSEGSWSLYGLVMPTSRVSHSAGHKFPVAKVTDPKLGASRGTSPRWVRVRSEYPDAIDSTTSHDGRLTVIVTPDTVFVHESSGTTLGRRLRSIPVSSKRVVMTQWLEDEALTKAAAAVAKL